MTTVNNTQEISKVVDDNALNKLPIIILTNAVNQTTGVSSTLTLPTVASTVYTPSMSNTPADSITINTKGLYSIKGNATITPATDGVSALTINKNGAAIASTKYNLLGLTTLAVDSVQQLEVGDVIKLVYIGFTAATISSGVNTKARLMVYKLD